MSDSFNSDCETMGNTSSRQRNQRNRSGLAALWVIAAAPAFVVLMVMVADMGFVWLARVELKNAAAAGALAGAQLEWTSEDTPEQEELRTRAHAAAREFTIANRVLGRFLELSSNNTPAAPYNNEECPGSILLGNVSGTTFDTTDGPLDQRGCRVEVEVFIDSLWPNLVGPYRVKVNATAAYDADSNIARLVHIEELVCE